MGNLATTVHLVDDDECVLRALRRLLVSAGHLVETHASGEDFLKRHDADVPGCAIVDLNLPGMDGFGIQEALNGVDRQILFLTACGNIPATVRAMRGGAVDFLMKPVEAEVLLEAVSLALKRDADCRHHRDERRNAAERLRMLTPRERQVFCGVIAGRLNKQIAARLGTVEKTVKVHRGRMMEKMGVRTVADLVRLAGLLPEIPDAESTLDPRPITSSEPSALNVFDGQAGTPHRDSRR